MTNSRTTVLRLFAVKQHTILLLSGQGVISEGAQAMGHFPNYLMKVMQCQKVREGTQGLSHFWTEGLLRCSLPTNPFPPNSHHLTCSENQADPPLSRAQRVLKENLQKVFTHQLGTRQVLQMDSLSRETHCMAAPSSVTYLEVNFFVWLWRIPFITGHLSTRERGKNYPWIHAKPSMSVNTQTWPCPQCRQYSFSFDFCTWTCRRLRWLTAALPSLPA